MKPVKVVAAVAIAVAASAVAAGCFVSPIIPIGGKSSTQAQRDSLSKLFPAQLAATTPYAGEVRTAKVRVWADEEYRSQNVRWQHGFDEQLDYANQVLIPMVGLRLEPEYRSWPRHAPGSRLEDQMVALVALDAGDDVAVVIGLTSALSLVSDSFHALGLAQVGGQHVVVRGHADAEERKAFERVFPETSAEERAAVVEARRRHKTTAVLIHELAHAFGALHEAEPDWVMSPSYSHRAASISDRNRELMLIDLDNRLKPAAARDPRATLRALVAALEVEWTGWVAGERDEHLAALREQLGAAPAAGIAGAVPVPAMEQYRHAEQLLARGDHRNAAATLEPLVAAYPAHAELRVLACKIELARGGAKDAKAIATCERAAGLSADVEPALEVAALRFSAGDKAGARRTLAAAETRLAALPPGKASAAWLALATTYQGIGAVTWAELALANAGAPAGGDRGVAQWAATTRARYGIPRDGARYKLVPEDDAAAVAAVRDAVALANASKFAAASKAIAAAEKRWPALPGLVAAHCDLELRRGAAAAARQYCDRAIEQGGSSWALYLRGILDLQGTGDASTTSGIARLRAAIALDPDLGQAWRSLGKALARAKATSDLELLRRDYRARFGTQLN